MIVFVLIKVQVLFGPIEYIMSHIIYTRLVLYKTNEYESTIFWHCQRIQNFAKTHLSSSESVVQHHNMYMIMNIVYKFIHSSILHDIL